MKTRKHTLTRVAMGVALATASLSALAQAPVTNPAAPTISTLRQVERYSAVDPTFGRGEQAALCLMESVVSLLAARANDFGCAPKTYDLDASVDSNGVGSVDIGGGVDNGGTTLTTALGANRDIGTRCQVREAPGLNKLNGVRVAYRGDHGWSRHNDIFNSYAIIAMVDPQTGSRNWYKEVNIKDYFKKVIGGRSVEFDWGLEDIKKWRNADAFYFPVSKWMEWSAYVHENGQEGGLWVDKVLTAPRSSACRVAIEADIGSIFNGGGAFELTGGTVSVGGSN